jgi:hypothetical protein
MELRLQVLWEPTATADERNYASSYIDDAVGHISSADQDATT